MKTSLVLAILFVSVCHPPGAFSTELDLSAKDKEQEIVVFNQKSLKYHGKDCSAVKSCKNCVEISRRKAKELGGAACKLCAGGE